MTPEERRKDVSRRRSQARIRQKETMNKRLKKSKQARDKYYHTGISIFAIGLLLITFRTLMLSPITSTQIKPIAFLEESIVGPFKVEKTNLYTISVHHNLRINREWCNMKLLLLDENKNYVSGAQKDLYYERDSEGVYSESEVTASFVINETGLYYFQVIPEYSNNSTVHGNIACEITSQSLGTNYSLGFGIFFLVIGTGLFVNLFSDYEITNYQPELFSVRGKKIFSIFSIIAVVIITYFIFSGITYQGYAGKSGFQDAPSSWYSNRDVHYFGD